MTRLPNYWWCEEHQEVHQGQLEDWNMDHRAQLHPVYAEMRPAAVAAR